MKEPDKKTLEEMLVEQVKSDDFRAQAEKDPSVIEDMRERHPVSIKKNEKLREELFHLEKTLCLMELEKIRDPAIKVDALETFTRLISRYKTNPRPDERIKLDTLPALSIREFVGKINAGKMTREEFNHYFNNNHVPRIVHFLGMTMNQGLFIEEPKKAQKASFWKKEALKPGTRDAKKPTSGKGIGKAPKS